MSFQIGMTHVKVDVWENSHYHRRAREDKARHNQRIQAIFNNGIGFQISDGLLLSGLKSGLHIVGGLVLTGTSVIMGVFSYFNFYAGRADSKTHSSHKT